MVLIISHYYAYTEALDHEQLLFLLKKKQAEEVEEPDTGEEMHNVFLRNTFSSNDLPITGVLDTFGIRCIISLDFYSRNGNQGRKGLARIVERVGYSGFGSHPKMLSKNH